MQKTLTLENFNIDSHTKSMSGPLALHFKLSAKMSPKTVNESEYMSHVLYTSLVGSLIYVMVCTRPDLSDEKESGLVQDV